MFNPKDLIIEEMNDYTTTMKDNITIEDIVYDIENDYYQSLLEAHNNHLKNCMIILENTRDMSLDSCIDIIHESKLLQTKLKIRDFITDTMIKIVQRYHKHMNTKQSIQYLETAFHRFPSLRKTRGYYVPRTIYYEYPSPPIENIEDTIFKDIDLTSHIAWKEKLKKNTFLSHIPSVVLSNNKHILSSYIQKNSKVYMKKKEYHFRGDMLDKIKEYQVITKKRIKLIYDHIQNLLIDINTLRNKVKETKDDIKDIDKDILSYNYNVFITDMEYLTKCLGFYMKALSFTIIDDLEVIKDLLTTMKDDMDEELKNTYLTPKLKKKPKLPAYYRTKAEDELFYNIDIDDPIDGITVDPQEDNYKPSKIITPYAKIKKTKKRGKK